MPRESKKNSEPFHSSVTMTTGPTGTAGRTFAEDSAIRRHALELRDGNARSSRPLAQYELDLAALDLTLDATGASLDIARGLSLVDLRISGTHWVRTFDGYWQANRLSVPARQLWESSEGFGGRGLALTTMRGINYAGLLVDTYQLYDAAANDRPDEAVVNGVDVAVGVGSVFVPPLGIGYFVGKGVGTLMFSEPNPTSVFDRLGNQ